MQRKFKTSLSIEIFPSRLEFSKAYICKKQTLINKKKKINVERLCYARLWITEDYLIQMIWSKFEREPMTMT